jgi:hypothetical protein
MRNPAIAVPRAGGVLFDLVAAALWKLSLKSKRPSEFKFVKPGMVIRRDIQKFLDHFEPALCVFFILFEVQCPQNPSDPGSLCNLSVVSTIE